MALEAYSPCPCGSGKKFKWCCQPIHTQIDRAFAQDAEGQHEAALRLMNEVVAQNPANPEALGRQAQLLFANDRLEEAEGALQKALAINPNYPFGHLLRGMFRQSEGELPGALLLFRKAADLYDPEARGHLANVYELIADIELRLNRPVAARAALRIALHFDPTAEHVRNALEVSPDAKSGYPASAWKDHAFRSPPPAAPPERRGAWDRALTGTGHGRLRDAAAAFEQLTGADPDDAAAWYNLGLARAWLGDNAAAVEALDRFIALEADPARAADAGALAEVLRLGHGMTDQTDYVEHSYGYRLQDGQAFIRCLQHWEEQRRLLILSSRQEEHTLMALVLEPVTALTPELAATRPPRLGAYLLLVEDLVRIWNTDPEAVEKVRDELQKQAGAGVAEGKYARNPAAFNDVLSAALAFPVGMADEEESRRRVREQVQRYFEEGWVHQPRKALDGVAPLDAAGHPVLRKKLGGVIQFLEECAAVSGQPYEFDRLRRKLGLLAEAPPAAPADGPGAGDVEAMSAAELAALPPAGLPAEQLERAYQAALKLDARDLAGRFAEALVNLPPRAERPDRHPWYAHLIQLALDQGDTDAALGWVDAGEKADCEHNEGRRRNDYELRRGQVLVRRGDADAAQDVFERLIQRLPAELRYRGSAAEGMLTLRQGAAALRFAEQGLAKSREQNNRESEGYFQELVAAARKMTN